MPKSLGGINANFPTFYYSDWAHLKNGPEVGLTTVWFGPILTLN